MIKMMEDGENMNVYESLVYLVGNSAFKFFPFNLDLGYSTHNNNEENKYKITIEN